MTFDQDAYEGGGWRTALAEDPYERLGLDVSCVAADVQTNYHTRRKWWEIQEQRLKGHTGHQTPLVQRVGPSVAEALRKLQEARDALSDPQRRGNLDFERTKRQEEEWHRRIGGLVEIAVADDRFLSLAERRQILRQLEDIPRRRAEAIIDQQAQAKGASVESRGGARVSSAAVAAIPPRISVAPSDFSFANVRVGERIRKSCVVSNIGGGVFSGRISSNRPWLRLEKEVLTPNLNRQEIWFSVDTRALPPGHADGAAMEFATSGGKAQVPIALSIELQEALRARFQRRFIPGLMFLSGACSVLASYLHLVRLSPVGLLLTSLFLAWIGAKLCCKSALVYRLAGGTNAGTLGRMAGLALGSVLVAALAVAMLSSIGSGPAALQQVVPQADTTVTVIGAAVNVRSGPEIGFSVLGRARRGQRMLATGRRRDWLAVRWPGSPGNGGWVARALVQGRDQDLARLPFLAQPVDCQTITGEWTGAVASMPAILYVRWRQGKCAGSMLYGGINESLDVKFLDEDSVTMQGTAYTPAGNAAQTATAVPTFRGRVSPPRATGGHREDSSSATVDASSTRGQDAVMSGTFGDAASHASEWSVRLLRTEPRDKVVENGPRIDSKPAEQSQGSSRLVGGVGVAGAGNLLDVNTAFIDGSYKLYPANDPLAESVGAMTIYQTGSALTLRGNGWTGQGMLSRRNGQYDWLYGDGRTGHCDFLVRDDGSLVGRVHGSRIDWTYVAQRTAAAPPLQPPLEPPSRPPVGR